MILLLLLRVVLVLLLVTLVPLAAHAVWWTMRGAASASWSSADWSSAGLLPEPSAEPRALVRIYAGRVGRWRGIFAHHSWIVVKEAGAARYTRFDKVGWGSPVRTNGWAADGRWFGNEPELVLALEGPEAARLIPRIRAAVAAYPYRAWGDYRAWPGPNSNTFVAHVMEAVPELRTALPPTALGKDWRPASDMVGLTPSRTGVRLQLGGLLGVSVGWIEGVEVNVLGVVSGVDLRRPALKLPGWGRLGLSPA
jgi:hypothetical protein